MKKYALLVVFVSAVFLTAWQSRSAFNRPKSVVITPSGADPVKIAFASNAPNSLIMTGLAGGYYQNISVINTCLNPLSILTIPEVSLAPAASVTDQRLHVVSNGSSTFDNISVFDNVYLASEDNQITNACKVKVTVW